jgi:hypothetical protein
MIRSSVRPVDRRYIHEDGHWPVLSPSPQNRSPVHPQHAHSHTQSYCSFEKAWRDDRILVAASSLSADNTKGS